MHERRAGGGEGGEALALGHGGGAHGGAGHDDRLGDVGQGQLAAEGRGRGGEGRHAGRDRPADAERVEPADLLGDRAVERGVAGMDPGHVLSGRMRGLDLGDDLRRGAGTPCRSPGRPQAPRPRPRPAPASRHRGRPGSAWISAQPAHGDQVGRARPGTDEMDGHRDAGSRAGCRPSPGRAGAAPAGWRCCRPARRSACRTGRGRARRARSGARSRRVGRDCGRGSTGVVAGRCASRMSRAMSSALAAAGRDRVVEARPRNRRPRPPGHAARSPS